MGWIEDDLLDVIDVENESSSVNIKNTQFRILGLFEAILYKQISCPKLFFPGAMIID